MQLAHHSLVGVKVKLYLQEMHLCLMEGGPLINSRALSQNIMVEKFIGAFKAALCSKSQLGLQQGPPRIQQKRVTTQDWLEAH